MELEPESGIDNDTQGKMKHEGSENSPEDNL